MKQQEEENYEDQIMVLSDDIPYAKVKSFSVEDIQVNNDKFILLIKKVCEGIPVDQDPQRLERDFNDINWLISKLMKESPQLVIMPLVQTKSYWDSIKDFTGNFKYGGEKNIRKQQERRFMRLVVERFFKILSQISLNYLYKIGNSKSSLFTFLDEKYGIYKMEIFQKDDETTVQVLKKKIGSSTKMFVGYISSFITPKVPQFQGQKKRISQLTQKINRFLIAHQKYLQSINTISQNFLNEQKQIQKKQQYIYLLFLKSQNISKILSHIQQQINFIITLSENAKKEDGNEINKQIQLYSKFINHEFEGIQKQMKRIMKEFVEATIGKNVNLNMNDLFTSK